MVKMQQISLHIFSSWKIFSSSKRSKSKRPDQIKILSIVKAELPYGEKKSQNKNENILNVNHFLLPYKIVFFDDESFILYSKIIVSLELRDTIIGPNDLIIASTVISNDGILVTNNVREYNYIKN
ncbi:MAG TPA: VapC toxin family PIN domain ribonuclease [Spirochaetia bacterium]|nr:VapC toxin family PIN domain ribonuclease [Spirochaetia bacterium]